MPVEEIGAGIESVPTRNQHLIGWELNIVLQCLVQLAE